MNFPIFAAISELQVFLDPLLAASEAGVLQRGGPWRPPQWNGPAQCSITAPVAQSGGNAGSFLGDNPFLGAFVPGAPSYSGQQFLVFDAVLQSEHTRELRRTDHPIQASASSPVSSITDHAFRMPAQITLEIGMSDAMASYSPGMWTGNASKSVSAYQTLVNLQKTRTLVTLTTRLATYKNMLVEGVHAVETAQTVKGLRASVLFSEIFLADVTAVKSGLVSADDLGNLQSSRPNLTGQTATGTVQTLTPSATLFNQHNITAATYAAKPLFATVPGAGSWSGTAIAGLLNHS